MRRLSFVPPFQSTLPAWGATLLLDSLMYISEVFQSTLPAWGATLGRIQRPRIIPISIHAPRVGSDPCVAALGGILRHFNPRSPRGERPTRKVGPESPMDFNPRSPRGERPIPVSSFISNPLFQSTLPAWGATIMQQVIEHNTAISIHAPRVGSDFIDLATGFHYDLFQSTLPAWGATRELSRELPPQVFQSTLPAWGATSIISNFVLEKRISIHAPRVGSDASLPP